MTLFLSIAALLLGFVTVGRTAYAEGEGAQQAESVVQAVQARYDATQDLAGEVLQETRLARVEKTVTARGTVAFKKPGKMRWELANGERETIVSDGRTLWMYRPEDEQVIRMPFTQAFRSSTPISFLVGVGKIADDFRASLENVGGQRLRLRLEPRRNEGDVGVLWLEVDKNTFDILAAEVQDPVGNRSKFVLQNVRRNSGLGDDLFQFSVPPGVDVLDVPPS